MNSTAKKELLAYSANPAPRRFRSWAEKERLPDLVRPTGETFRQYRDKPTWTMERTVAWLRRNGGRMVQEACNHGWHMRLLDYVSHRHRLPNRDDIEALVEDQLNLNRVKMPPKIIEARERLKGELMAPVEMKMAS